MKALVRPNPKSVLRLAMSKPTADMVAEILTASLVIDLDVGKLMEKKYCCFLEQRNQL